MGDFAIWTPKFDGDAPPNWKAGMARSFRRLHSDAEWHLITEPSSDDLWWAKNEYAVPHEAIFDYPTWAAQGRANADKLPSGVAEALGPERDWADELHYLLQETKPSERCALIKSRCRPIGNDTVTDEWLREQMVRLIKACGFAPKGINYNAIELLRAIIAEATQ